MTTANSVRVRGTHAIVPLVPVQRTCPFCYKTEIRKYPQDGLLKYKAGALVQDAFPDADASEREWFISGMCDSCQGVIFSDEEEIEDLDELEFEDYEFEDDLDEMFSDVPLEVLPKTPITIL